MTSSVTQGSRYGSHHAPSLETSWWIGNKNYQILRHTHSKLCDEEFDSGDTFSLFLSIFYISQRLTWYFVFLYLIFLSQQVLYFLLSTLVLTLYIDVVLSLSIICNTHTRIDWVLLNFTPLIQQNYHQPGRKFEKLFCAVDRLSCQLELSKSETSQFRSDRVFDIVNYVHLIFFHGG